MPGSQQLTAPSAGANRQPELSPYVGLSFYTEDKADYFFGRDGERQVIMANLRAARLTLLYAESGVGKSSLLRAGVAARLDELARHKFGRGGAVQVPVVFNAWKDDPVEDLIAEIERIVGSYIGPAEAPTLPRSSLAAAIEAAVAALDRVSANRAGRSAEDEDDHGGSTLLIILDQFEEFFLYGSKNGRSPRLADDLAEALTRPSVNANFLISIREDAYSLLGDLLRGRLSNVYGNYVHLEYLDTRAAREAVEKPVERYNALHPDETPVEIEPGLVNMLLEQVRRQGPADQNSSNGRSISTPAAFADGQIVTPYLQLVMTTLWDRELSRGSHRLRLSTLDEFHGAQQIVADHLDAALASLPPEERDAAVDALRYLVTPSGTKIALEVGDLAAFTERPLEQIANVVQGLSGNARILRRVPPAPGRSPDEVTHQRYEIYHDVLAAPINETASKRALEHARRRVHRFRRIAAGAGALAFLALLGAVAAVLATLGEASARKDAQSRQLAASAQQVLPFNPETASLLAVRAMRIAPTELAQSALRAALPQLQVQRTLQVQPIADSAALSPDGSLAVVGTEDGLAHLWDLQSHQQIATLGVAGFTTLNAVAFSPDGKRIATVYSDGTGRIWNTTTHAQVGEMLNASASGQLDSVAFSPSGRYVVTGGDDAYVRVWDTRTMKQTATMSDASSSGSYHITGVAWSPNGKYIAASTLDGEAYLWSASSDKEIGSGVGPGADSTLAPSLNSIAFSPDSTKFVTSGEDGTAQVWGTANQAALQSFRSPTRDVLQDAEFSPSGQLIVTAGLDGKALIWKASGSTASPVGTLNGTAGTSMLRAAFDRSGSLMVTAGADGSGTIWDIRSRRARSTLANNGSDLVNGVAYSPDGRSVATGSRTGTVSVWQAATGAPRLHFALPDLAGADQVTYSGDGRDVVAAGSNGSAYVIDATTGAVISQTTSSFETLARASFDPTNSQLLLTAGQDDTSKAKSQIRFWDLHGTASPTQSGKTLTEPGGAQLQDARFSPDGTRFVTADYNGKAYIWDTQTRAIIGAAISEPSSAHANVYLYSAAFSHDGKFVVTSGDDGTARIWDAVNPRHPLVATFTEPAGNSLLDAEFGAGDRSVVASSRDGAVYVWDRASGRQLLALTGHSGAVTSLDLSSDGSELVTGGNDGTAKIWSTVPVGQQGGVLADSTRQDMNTVAFSPDGGMIATASSDGTTSLWTAGAEHRLVQVLHEPGGAGVASAEFARQARLLVTGDANGSAIVWNAQGQQVGSPMTVASNFGGLASAEFSPNGQLIVTATDYGGAFLWNAKTHKPTGGVLDSKTFGVRWASFSPNSRLVVTAEQGGQTKAWNVFTGQQEFPTLTEPGAQAMSGAWFSPVNLSIDGRVYDKNRVVVTSSDDGTARIWNLSTGVQLRAFTEPGRNAVYNAVISPDGTRLATSSQDGTARLWDIQTGELLTTFYGGDPTPDVEFGPGGNTIATAEQWGLGRVFSTALAGPIQGLMNYAQQHLTRALSPSELATYARGS